MHTLETKIHLCRLLSAVTRLQRNWEYVYKIRPQMWGCHTVQSVGTSWIHSLIYKKANKKKPKVITFLPVLLFRMKLQTQLNTCRLPSFSYCNPFLFLRHSCPVPPHPLSKLLFQALLSRNFYFKSFLIARTYSVVSVSSSKSYLKIYYVASFPRHSWQRQGYTQLTVILSFFLVLCSCCSHALQQNNILVSDVKHVRFSYFAPFRSINFINNVRVSVYFHDGDWISLCFICQAPHAYERGRSLWSNQPLFLLGFLFSILSKSKISHG